jgi:hypothetical protein
MFEQRSPTARLSHRFPAVTRIRDGLSGGRGVRGTSDQGQGVVSGCGVSPNGN